MPRRVLIVRHCQSQANAEGRIEGRGDSALSAEGERQAERVAAFIAAQGLAEVTLIASSQARAIATAGAIGAACGWDHVSDHRIREGELGWIEEMSYVELGRHMRERSLTVLDADLHGGESLDAVAERLWEAIAEALDAYPGVLVLVSHGYAIGALLRRLTRAALPPSFVGNGDVVELMLEDGALAEPPRHYPLNSVAGASER